MKDAEAINKLWSEIAALPMATTPADSARVLALVAEIERLEAMK